VVDTFPSMLDKGSHVVVLDRSGFKQLDKAAPYVKKRDCERRKMLRPVEVESELTLKVGATIRDGAYRPTDVV
jgi:hypothetical protein